MSGLIWEEEEERDICCVFLTRFWVRNEMKSILDFMNKDLVIYKHC